MGYSQNLNNEDFQQLPGSIHPTYSNKPQPPLPSPPSGGGGGGGGGAPRDSPVSLDERRARLIGILDTKGDVSMDELEEFSFFIEGQIDYIHKTIKAYLLDAPKGKLGVDPEGRLNEVLQAVEVSREILSFDQNLYSPYFNSNIRIQVGNFTTLTTDRKASAIFGCIIEYFFKTTDIRDPKIFSALVSAKVDDRWVITLNTVGKIIGIYVSIRTSGLVAWNKDKLYSPILKAFSRRLSQITPDEMRKFRPQDMRKTLGDIGLLKREVYSTDARQLNDAEEKFMQECMKTDIMEKQMYGVSQITDKIQATTSIYDKRDIFRNLMDSGALLAILGRNAHLDVVKGAKAIIKFAFGEAEKDSLAMKQLVAIIFESVTVNKKQNK